MTKNCEVVGYWNHNTAFHDELIARAAEVGGRMLDVGCGDGLLMSRLATVAREVVGIDTDPAAIMRARERLEGVANARVFEGNVLTDMGGATFDVVTCVAALHHLPLRSGLARLRTLVAPGGVLLVIGLAANKSPWDWVVSGLQVVPLWIAGKLRHEVKNVGVVTAVPRESFREIRAAVFHTIPSAVVRRRFYYRYSIVWRRPGP